MSEITHKHEWTACQECGSIYCKKCEVNKGEEDSHTLRKIADMIQFVKEYNASGQLQCQIKEKYGGDCENSVFCHECTLEAIERIMKGN